jgi:hypothetical protein
VTENLYQDFQRELRKTRQELKVALCETMPSKDFAAIIIVATVGLHVIEARIRKTQNLDERRQVINEFNRGKRAVEKGIQLLRQGNKEESKSSGTRYGKVLP